MTTQDYMSILYPVLTGLSGGYAITKFWFWWTTRRTAVTFFDSLFFTVETLILLLHTLLTGSHPLFDINQFRFIVVLLRFAMAIVLIICTVSTIRMIFLFGTRGKN